jgi:hypothetical protein
MEFRGFSRELAEVLTGLARSSNCFVVNTIEVAPAGKREGEQNQPGVEIPGAAPTPPMPGRSGRSGGTNAAPSRRGPTTNTPPGQPAPGRGGTGRGRLGGGAGALEPAAPIMVAAAVPPAAPGASGGARGAPPGTGGTRGPGSASSAPETVLREELLLITISVEVVNFN